MPPDYFNADGQVWGNALYDWSALEKSGFQFWVERAKQMQSMYDLTRIDHFIGFYRYWEIPAGAKNAKKGTWRFVPGEALFKTLDRALGGLPFIAEDLGKTTPEVFALRDQFALPGMRVLHFGFGATYDSARATTFPTTILSTASPIRAPTTTIQLGDGGMVPSEMPRNQSLLLTSSDLQAIFRASTRAAKLRALFT